MAEQECPQCHKSFKRLDAHIRTAHMREQYNMPTKQRVLKQPPSPMPKKMSNIPPEPLKIGHPVRHPDREEVIWTPALIEAQRRSKNEENYRRNVSFGSKHLSWKMVVVIAIVIIVCLLFATGRIQL
jgi:hypothetical protein